MLQIFVISKSVVAVQSMSKNPLTEPAKLLLLVGILATSAFLAFGSVIYLILFDIKGGITRQR